MKTRRTIPKDAVLCYVRGQWAYFTTQPLEKQWGDDWDDAPYEHNAGEPYEDWQQKASPRWRIYKAAWDGGFDEPCEGKLNSEWSVQDINRGAVPWLRTSRYSSGPKVCVLAGVGLDEFMRLVKDGGGRVYLPEQNENP